MIKIGTSHSMFHDGTCWVVIEHSTKGRKGAAPKLETKGGQPIGHRTYYTDVSYALKRVLNSKLKGARSVAGLEEKLATAYAEVIAVGKEIRDAQSRVIKRVLDET